MEAFENSEYGIPQPEIHDAFSVAILIRYFRAFGSGVRKNLKVENVETFSNEQLKDHQFFKEYRDKFVAHSVNVFEDTTIQARYCKERVLEEGIASIGELHNRIIGLRYDQVERVRALCESLLKYVEVQKNIEHSKLLQIMRSLPIQEVLSFHRKTPSNPSDSQVTKVRK